MGGKHRLSIGPLLEENSDSHPPHHRWFADNNDPFPHNEENGCIPAAEGETAMTETIQAPPVPREAPPPSPAAQNPAVAFCCEVHKRALKAASDNGRSQIGAVLDAGRAYRNALPPLSGHENIRDFIACIAHGMLMGAIEGPDATRLLYAAQVAHTTDAKGPGRPKTAK
jgi:hypothetical protein